MQVTFTAEFPESMRQTFQALKPGVVGNKQDIIDAFEMSDNFTVVSVEVE